MTQTSTTRKRQRTRPACWRPPGGAGVPRAPALREGQRGPGLDAGHGLGQARLGDAGAVLTVWKVGESLFSM